MPFFRTLGSLSAPLAHFFRFWSENGSQKGPALEYCGLPFGAPGLPKNASATQARFFMDLRPILETILVILAHFYAHFCDFGSLLQTFPLIFIARGRQLLPAPCFQMFRFYGQDPKVSAVALPLQSADTGRCQAFQIKEGSAKASLGGLHSLPPGAHLGNQNGTNSKFISGIKFWQHFFIFYNILRILVSLWLPFGSFGTFWMHFGFHGSLLAHFVIIVV